MKTSILMKIVAPLTICAVFPLGAIAEPAFLRERHGSPVRGVIEKVNAPKVNAPKVKAPRKHYFAHNWLET